MKSSEAWVRTMIVLRKVANDIDLRTKQHSVSVMEFNMFLVKPWLKRYRWPLFQAAVDLGLMFLYGWLCNDALRSHPHWYKEPARLLLVGLYMVAWMIFTIATVKRCTSVVFQQFVAFADALLDNGTHLIRNATIMAALISRADTPSGASLLVEAEKDFGEPTELEILELTAQYKQLLEETARANAKTGVKA